MTEYKLPLDRFYNRVYGSCCCALTTRHQLLSRKRVPLHQDHEDFTQSNQRLEGWVMLMNEQGHTGIEPKTPISPHKTNHILPIYHLLQDEQIDHCCCVHRSSPLLPLGHHHHGCQTRTKARLLANQQAPLPATVPEKALYRPCRTEQEDTAISLGCLPVAS